MVWGRIPASGVGDLLKIDGILNMEKYNQLVIHCAISSGNGIFNIFIFTFFIYTYYYIRYCNLYKITAFVLCFYPLDKSRAGNPKDFVLTR